ncbi:flavin reductase family protein [Miniphocaeibacter massiliensis]|uniref:flavin reductase family protein n=1 Tax=Miniphocaeibacter massiliensis TaxID=2041841 RepID=UPI000C1C44B1|nr:flavin reductase family protein [Miniphocaeibacter massiliensis]
MSFKEIDIKEMSFNPFNMIGDEWTLITAGNNEKYNTMTASWGNIGVTWNKNTLVSYIRPQRYTREFVEDNELYTVSIYNEEFKKDLEYLGTVSGRDEEKVSKTSLTPFFTNDTVAFNEANTIFICRKLYCGKITPEGFIDKNIIEESYPDKDFHYVYIGEIVKVLVKE